MRRLFYWFWVLICVGSLGCSTAPMADFLDFVSPSRPNQALPPNVLGPVRTSPYVTSPPPPPSSVLPPGGAPPLPPPITPPVGSRIP